MKTKIKFLVVSTTIFLCTFFLSPLGAQMVNEGSSIPDYLQDLLKLSQSKNSFGETSNTNEDFSKFLNALFHGVTSNSCKVHVTEWFWRMTHNQENLLSDKDKWVLHMVDAWGKFPEGILSGHIGSHGDFDECIQINVKDLDILNEIYPKTDISKRFEGQYCTSYILDYSTAMQITPIPPINDSSIGKLYSPEFDNSIKESLPLGEFLRIMFSLKPSILPLVPSEAVCMPNSCSLPDVQQILMNGAHLMYSALRISISNQTDVLPWPVTVVCTDAHKPPLDTGAIIVIILLAVLVTLALGAGIVDYYLQCQKSKSEVSPGSPTGGYRYTAFKYFMAFSLYTNIKKWLSTRKTADDMGCLHGIRFFSTCWVVLAHTYGAFLQAPQWNFIDINNLYNKWTELAVINGTVSVDTFFVMSGMLATYSILKMLDKTRGKFNIVMFYVHRYIRLTPTYAILVAIGTTLLTYAGNGPQWFNMNTTEEYCRKNWWTNLLYINNLVNAAEMCNGESWYLANDMQFYILSPFIVYPIWKWPPIGMLLLAIYTILSCIAQVLVVRYGTDVPPAMVLTTLGDGTGSIEIYNRPWSRISTFLVGVWLGWLLYKTRGKRVKLTLPLIILGWLCSTGTALAVIFGIFPWFNPANKIPKIGGYFYAGLSRFSWGMAIAWVIFACVKGYGGIVNKFLSWKVFMPLGRLCFCVYLTSIHLQIIFHSRLTIPIKWDTYTIVNLFFAHLVMSFMVGFLSTLLFESPFITLQKLIFDGKARGAEPRKSLNEKPALDVKMNTINVEKAVKDSTE